MNCLKQLAEDIINKIASITVILVLCSFSMQQICNAQTAVKVDSSSVKNPSLSDTTKFMMQKSPWGAVLRSAALPGFGQFYNESYWKIPLFWGVLGYLGYQWNTNNNSYKTYKDLYNKSLNLSSAGIEEYYKKREFYRDQRDMFAVFIGITYFLNLVDAYVDSHLFDFNVETDQVSNNYQISVKIRL